MGDLIARIRLKYLYWRYGQVITAKQQKNIARKLKTKYGVTFKDTYHMRFNGKDKKGQLTFLVAPKVKTVTVYPNIGTLKVRLKISPLKVLR